MTTRFCAQCGMLLEATAWYGGVCPSCGAKVDVTRGVLGPEGADSAEVATRVSDASDSGASAYGSALEGGGLFGSVGSTTPVQHPQTAPIPLNASTPPDASRSRRSPSPWMLALIAVLVIALVGVSAYALAQRDPISIIVSPFAAAGASASSSSSSNSSSSSGSAPNATGGGASNSSGNSVWTGAPASPTNTVNSGATAAPTTSATPVGIGTAPPGSTVVPTVSATAGPTPIGSPMPGPAILSVSPSPRNLTLCPTITSSTSFTVANTGGQPLTWSASDNGNGYTIKPASGMVDPGTSMPVTVSQITKSGTVTFSAPNAQGSPTTVTITCNLL